MLDVGGLRVGGVDARAGGQAELVQAHIIFISNERVRRGVSESGEKWGKSGENGVKMMLK